MEMMNKAMILRELPLFSNLSQEKLALIAEKSRLVDFRKGQVIYQENDPADAFYCVILGRVMIYTQDNSGAKQALEYLHRGKYFGIISLLTGEPHSVSAVAFSDATLLAINKEEFDSLLKEIPQLALDLSQTLSRRLKSKEIRRKAIFESMIIPVFSSYARSGKTVYSLNLALSLKKETHKSVIILELLPGQEPHSLPRRLGLEGDYPIVDLGKESANIDKFCLKDRFAVDLACFHYLAEDRACVQKLLEILSRLVNDYHYLILDLPASMDECVFAILNQSDEVHLLTGTDEVELKRTRRLIDKLKNEFGFPLNKIKVLINEYKLSKFSHQQQQEILRTPVFATLPKITMAASDKLILDDPEGEYAKVVRRISRQLGDCLVGLVLGVGVGYGLCHIGVLKVIEEEKIPIDVICGASIGAVVAGLWAVGKDSREILDITSEFREAKYVWNLVDLTIPFFGFIKGNKLRKFLKKHLGNKTFSDVRLPLRIVASDLRSKEPIVFDRGPLVDALMASCAMPGVFNPFQAKDRLLLDGGVTNPLPTEVLFKMGVRKIIAVNVTPSREDIRRQREIIQAEHIPVRSNIVDTIFSSFETMQSEIIRQEAGLADIVLHPDTSSIHWVELHRAREFAKRGEEEARRNLDKIWQVINE